MNNIKNLISGEPVLVTGFVEALLALLVAFGADFTAEQTASIIGFTGIALALVARSFVSPVSKVGEQ